ncbi:O-antigen ligase family protein [Ramlibacter tataouinensis]|uniref:O-antigen ligase family protein n=1 Tax=Ramlibacter tataouinensis TaxID=94132 RepID=UPI0022F382AC|nr:O-antigen ligase family protein [Ramlibacter tataouinensis]WBY01282.1 O-antigen ligase family protein [Ramlibacter tataouinensis]
MNRKTVRRPGAAEATTVTARETARPEPFKLGRDGLVWLVFPALLVLSAMEVLLSGRDLTQSFLALQREVQSLVESTRHPLLAWVQRGVSLMLIAVCLERMVSHVVQRKPVPAPMLTWTFLFFWLTTVAAPAVFSSHPSLSHEYLYPLLLGLACSLAGPGDRERIFAVTRNALFVFLLASAALIPVMPSLVLDTSYTQGLIPGLPRFGGLATHAVGMGMLAQTALVILWARPLKHGWLNAACWGLGLGALFLAQSKTAWLCFLLSGTCLMAVRRAPDAMQRAGDPRRSSFGVGLCLLVIGAVLAALVAVLAFDLPTAITDFFDTREGAQLASLTGRDRIWVVAMEEWARQPVFGYGLTLWDAGYREAIGMPQATHAHNQMIDTLARSGTVGAVGLVLYALVLTVMAFRYARATGGLSLALYVSQALLSISEVPLILIDYGSHVMTHFLLIVAVASGAAARVQARAAPVVPIEPTLRTRTAP